MLRNAFLIVLAVSSFLSPLGVSHPLSTSQNLTNVDLSTPGSNVTLGAALYFEKKIGEGVQILQDEYGYDPREWLLIEAQGFPDTRGTVQPFARVSQVKQISLILRKETTSIAIETDPQSTEKWEAPHAIAPSLTEPRWHVDDRRITLTSAMAKLNEHGLQGPWDVVVLRNWKFSGSTGSARRWRFGYLFFQTTTPQEPEPWVDAVTGEVIRYSPPTAS